MRQHEGLVQERCNSIANTLELHLSCPKSSIYHSSWVTYGSSIIRILEKSDCAVMGPRAGSRLAPSQWETSLQSNAVSHWLGANLESALGPHCWSCWSDGEARKRQSPHYGRNKILSPLLVKYNTKRILRVISWVGQASVAVYQCFSMYEEMYSINRDLILYYSISPHIVVIFKATLTEGGGYWDNLHSYSCYFFIHRFGIIKTLATYWILSHSYFTSVNAAKATLVKYEHD